jgi:capsular exopolysaccharide synthesis family protein
LRTLAETVGSDDSQTLAMQQQFAIEHLAAVRKELLDVQSQKRKLEAILNARRPGETLQETSATSIPEADVDRLIEQDPDVASLAAKLAAQEARYRSERSHLNTVARKGGSDPSLRRLWDELNLTRKQLKQQRSERRRFVIGQLQNPITGTSTAADVETQQQLTMFQNLEARLKEDIKALSDGNHKFTVKTLDLQDSKDELAQLDAAAKKVAAEVEALTVERNAPKRIRLMDEAVVPRSRDDVRRYMMIGLTIFGSFFGGLFGVAFLELLSQKVDTADEVPSELGLRVVGALPIVPAESSRGTTIGSKPKDDHWHAVLLESIDATRTMLVHSARTDSYRVVMIASAIGGEGKTSLACHLATSLARGGLTTLLIDADLRRPAIHRVFDLPLAAGLSELLRGEVNLSDVIAAAPVEELKIITAGRCNQETIRALAQGCLGSVLGQLKEQFDFVIVDSSPILPVADAMIIAQQADAVLFSVFRDVSRKTKVAAAVQRLECLGVTILGAVVTGAHGGLYGNEYHPSYSYPPLSGSAASPSDGAT